MSKYYDDQGNEVEAFSQEELEAKIAEKLKAVTPEKADVATPQVPSLDPLYERLTKAEQMVHEMRVEKLADIYAGNDVDKRTLFVNSFNRLTGYEDNQNGLSLRAKDAAKLAFGDMPEDLSSLSSIGPSSSTAISPQTTTTEADQAIRAALGITQDDADKYGKK